jgi:hypothetical protein
LSPPVSWASSRPPTGCSPEPSCAARARLRIASHRGSGCAGLTGFTARCVSRRIARRRCGGTMRETGIKLAARAAVVVSHLPDGISRTGQASARWRCPIAPWWCRATTWGTEAAAAKSKIWRQRHSLHAELQSSVSFWRKTRRGQ